MIKAVTPKTTKKGKTVKKSEFSLKEMPIRTTLNEVERNFNLSKDSRLFVMIDQPTERKLYFVALDRDKNKPVGLNDVCSMIFNWFKNCLDKMPEDHQNEFLNFLLASLAMLQKMDKIEESTENEAEND